MVLVTYFFFIYFFLPLSGLFITLEPPVVNGDASIFDVETSFFGGCIDRSNKLGPSKIKSSLLFISTGEINDSSNGPCNLELSAINEVSVGVINDVSS